MQQLVAGFRLEELIGRGAMAEVYRATDEATGEVVALKLLDGSDERFRQRFLRESEIAARVDQLLEHHTYAQIAGTLNTRKAPHGGHTAPWTGEHVARYSQERGLRSHHQRLRDRGLLTLHEMARQLPAHTQSIKRWHQLGLITGEQADDRGIFLYHPGQTRPTSTQVRQAGQHLGDPRRSGRRNPHRLSGRQITITWRDA